MSERIDLADGPYGGSNIAETHSAEPLQVMLARVHRNNIAFYFALGIVVVAFLLTLTLYTLWLLSGPNQYPNLDGETLATVIQVIISGSVGYGLKGS